MESDIVSGQQSAWVLLKKLGEGDAGEVFLVESLLEKKIAILKRPGRSAFASDVIRQTSQINTEARILKTLSAYLDMEPGLGVRVPRVIDQSQPGTAFSERLFIIIEKANGFDLSQLARIARMGALSGAEYLAEMPEEKRFLQTLSQSSGGVGSFSHRILLSILNSLFEIFNHIHNHQFDLEGFQPGRSSTSAGRSGTSGGILWNDVKPEHLYWDPLRAKLTVIDWGNGQILERDGATRDRRFTAQDDYRQLLEAMGTFMEMAAPELRQRLAWPERLRPYDLTPEVVAVLRQRVQEALQTEMEGLAEVRRRELELLRRERGLSSESSFAPVSQPGTRTTPLQELEALHRQIISYGELPDYAGSLYFALEHAAHFAQQQLLEEVQEICEWAVGLPGSDSNSLRLCGSLARMASRSLDDVQRAALTQSVQAALGQDWSSVLWNLVDALRDAPEPDWWYELISTIRRQALGEQAGDVHPLLVARRTLLTLIAMLEKMHDQGTQPAAQLRLQTLIKHLREEIIPAWLSIDPPPPYANLAYTDIDEILEEIAAFLPDARYQLDRALAPARQQVRQILAEWEQGNFGPAANGLRQMLLWDPDRKRVLRADQSIQNAPAWLDKVHAGPLDGEHYRHFVTEIEFEGRDLRNHIGPAGWLDLILEGCRQLRKGAWPPALLLEFPALVLQMPWLAKFERRERLPEQVANIPALSAPNPAQAPDSPVPIGVVKGNLGPGQDLELAAPLDGWIPEARGSSARVFAGLLRTTQGNPVPAAIKLMRMDKTGYALPLFREEVLVLNAMSDVPGVTPMLECGFLQIEGQGSLPSEREDSVQHALTGNLIRIGPKSSQEFIYQLENRAVAGWTPYLAIHQREARHNLLALCDMSLTGGQFLPVEDLLQISIQICDILAEAHRRNIVYRDHKILHYYWIESTRGVYVIDWNVARLHPDGLPDYEKQMDMVQFGARALHHILTGRTAPGALPMGPTRPEEIEQAAKTYQAQWTYDDQRLSAEVRDLVEKVLAGEYTSAADLGDDLKQCFLGKVHDRY